MSKVVIDRAVVEQALEALRAMNPYPASKEDQRASALAALLDALAQQAEPAQEQDVEDAIEAAYWHFDARKKGLNEWAYAPQSERDAFKAEARKLVRGYFPTRQAQDTKREMLVVADAFIRGKRSAQGQERRAMAQAYEAGWKAALAQLQQVGWMQKSTGVIRCDWDFDKEGYVPVYVAQEQSE